MTFRVDRAIGGTNSKQLSIGEVKTSLMLRGRAVGGPRDGIILEAPRSWDGIVSDPVQTRNGIRMVQGAGFYRWNEITWVWREVINDVDPIRQSSEESGKWGYF